MATVLDRRGGDRPRDARELLCRRCGDVVTDFAGHTLDDVEHGHVFCPECLACACGETMTVWEYEADGCCRECAWGEGDLDR